MTTEKENLTSHFYTAVISSAATAVFGGVLFLVSYVASATVEKSVNIGVDTLISRLVVDIRPGQVAVGSDGFDFTASCGANEIAIGGSCWIASGKGAIQNISQTATTYSCTFSREFMKNEPQPPKVDGQISVACLHRK